MPNNNKRKRMAKAKRQAALDEKFLTPHTCPIPNCELTLVLDDRTQLYVCKHSLYYHSQYFQGMIETLFTNRQVPDNLRIPNVHQHDLLLFLRCIDCPSKLNLSLVSSLDIVRILIPLIHRFMCPAFERSLSTHILTKLHDGSVYQKLALVEQSNQYKRFCPNILDSAVRICNDLEPEHIEVIRGRVDPGILAAIYGVVAETRLRVLANPPICVCGQLVYPWLAVCQQPVRMEVLTGTQWRCPRCWVVQEVDFGLFARGVDLETLVVDRRWLLA